MSDQDIILHWKRCVKMHPNEASFHFYLGTAYLTLERYNDAMDSIEAALAIEKKPDWLYWFAAPMIGLGMIDPALSVYKEYVDSNPPTSDSYQTRAILSERCTSRSTTMPWLLCIMNSGRWRSRLLFAFLPFILRFCLTPRRNLSALA